MTSFLTLSSVLISIFFNAATASAGEEPLFSTAVLRKHCACFERKYESQEYETVPIFLKKGFFLGKYCHADEEGGSSRPETICRLTARGTAVSAFLCPTRCLSLKETPRLSQLEQKIRIQEGIRSLRETYRKTIPTSVIRTLDEERPQWTPVFYIRGEKNYELWVVPYSIFYIESPRLKKSQSRDYSIVLFHDAPKDGEEPTGWIGVFDKETGKAVKWIEYPQMGTYSDSYMRKMKVFLAPPPRSARYLRMTELGISDASTMDWGPIGPSMKEADESFYGAALIDLPARPKY